MSNPPSTSLESLHNIEETQAAFQPSPLEPSHEAASQAIINNSTTLLDQLPTCLPTENDTNKRAHGAVVEITLDSNHLHTEVDTAAYEGISLTKKAKTNALTGDLMREEDAPLIPPATKGISIFNDADVLSGRGGGTNVHPGNREFRDLINLNRRGYLKARKNDKPAISRSIVRSIRQQGGHFLKKDEKTGLWFEIGDDAAREKTSQALRQRAPEMRKLLFDTEREEARVVAEDQLRQQRLMMGLPPDGAIPNVFAPQAAYFALAQQQQGKGMDSAAYQQMFALMNSNAAAAAMFGVQQQQPQQQQQLQPFTNNHQNIGALEKREV